MNAAVMRRLEALESVSPKQESSDPNHLYQVMIDHDMEAPEPMPGEDTRAWLTRVPTATLDAVIHQARNAHGQP